MGSGNHRSSIAASAARRSLLTAVPAQASLLGTVAFVFAVVSTPREQVWAFAIDLAMLLGLTIWLGLPVGSVLRRLTIELPFVVFAVMMPFIGGGPHTRVLGIELSDEGLWAAWNILAKGTLGVWASVLLVSTTTVPAILGGLERLRIPRTLVAITAFMIRYGDVLADEALRMRIARISRGDDARWLWQAKATAVSTGTLFVRSYERGERVHLAMLSRGYAGSMPDRGVLARPVVWVWCSTVPLAAAIVSVTAWWSR